MTSRKSLNKKKGTFYSFISTLKTVLVPCSLLALLSVGAFGLVPGLTFHWYEKDFDYETQKEVIRQASEYYKFLTFMDGDETVLCYFFLAIVAVISLLVGVAVFRFSADKKTVNVYYSLGIKRTTLFYSRYFAGALALCGAIALGIISSYIVNLIYVGLSWQLSVVLLYFYCGLSLFALLVYSVTAAVFAGVGTVSESILYSVGVLALPTVILVAVQNLLSSFVSGTAFGLSIVPYSMTDTMNWSSERSSLLTQYTAYNPVLFFSDALIKYSVGTKDEVTGKLLTGADSQAWSFPSVTAVLPWFLVVVAVAFLGGAVLFRLRKAEHCGFLNTNKVLSTAVLFELMFFAASVAITGRSNGSIIIGVILAPLVYIAFEIFLERNVRLFFTRLWKLPALAAGIVVIFAVFFTGFFGYENRVPKVENIESVRISLPVSQCTLSLRSSTSGYNSQGFVRTGSYYWPYELPEISDRGTVKLVTEVHKNAVEKKEEGVYFSTVSYTLKGGREIKRSVYFDSEEMKKMLSVFDAPECRSKMAEMMNYQFPENPTSEQLRESGLSMFRYENAAVTAIGKNMFEGKRINLSKAEFDALKAALIKDVEARKAADYFGAVKEQVGIIRFSTDILPWGYDEYSGEDPEDLFGSDGIQTERLTDEPFDYTDFGTSEWSECPHFDVLIDSGMTNTLEYLGSIGASECFAQTKKIVSVSFRSAAISNAFNSERSSDESGREIFADSISENRDYWEYGENKKNFVSDYSENIITDEERISQLDSLMRLHAFSYGEGYWCLVAYSDGTCSSRFLPENIAPDYVRNFKYTLLG